MGSRQSGHSTTGALCAAKPSQSHSLDASQPPDAAGAADQKELSETPDAASSGAGGEAPVDAAVRPGVPSVVVVEPTSRGIEEIHLEPQVCEIRVQPPTPTRTPSEAPSLETESRTAPSAPLLPDDTSSSASPATTSKPDPAPAGHTSNTDSTDSAERRPFRPSAPDLPSYEDAVIASLAPEAGGDSRTPKAPGAAKQPSALPRVRDVRVGVNLVRAAGKLLTFLATVDAHPALYSGPLVKAALRRYERLWLPLAAKGECEGAAPPLDVHWVWLVHMLAPQHYHQDCQAVAGTQVHHRLMTSKALERARERGRRLWEAEYPEEAWDLPLDGSYAEGDAAKDAEKDSKISYDLRTAVERQSVFYYQVSLPHYRNKGFLRRSERRYRQFLALKKLHPDKFLVPCYDMDVIWHAHQVHPAIYKRDTESLLEQLLPHDDSVNDRSPGSRLVSSDTVTRGLWVPSFGSTFWREGSMYRGDPPQKHISPLPPEMEKEVHSSLYHCQILKLAIRGNAPDGALKIKIKHETMKVAELSLFHEQQKGVSEHNVTDLGLIFSLHDQMAGDWLVLKMSPKRRFSKFLNMFGHGNFWCMMYLNELFNIKTEGTIVKVFEDGGAVVEVTLQVFRTLSSSYVPLGILTGPFMPIVLNPNTLLQLQGIVTSNYSDDSDIFLAEMATHRLINETDPKKPQVLEMEVCHSRHLNMSSIHVYAQDASGRKLVSLAHTLDANTLPSPASLKCQNASVMAEKVAMCNVSEGERAMIIKTAKGDWAIVIAAWEGLRRGLPGTLSRRGIPGSPGHLVLRVHCPPSAPATIVSLPYDQQLYSYNLQDLYIDMQSGIFK